MSLAEDVESPSFSRQELFMPSLTKHIASLAVLSFSSWAFAQPAASPPAQPLSKQQIEQQHRLAMKKCNELRSTGKKICEAEADGKKSIAEAEARVAERNSPKTRMQLAETKADAEFEVAKARCEDQVGDARDTCRRNAKAARDKAKEQAKRDSQTNTQSPSSNAATGSGVESPSDREKGTR